MAQSTPSSDGVFGRQQLSSSNNQFNEISFLFQQLLGRINTATLVSVKAVHADGRTSPVGYVDVTPLVNQIDGLGQPVPHGTIYQLPFVRMQGGTNALIVDPKAGDVGLAIFCDHDISSVKASGGQANPGSRRVFDMSDGIYLGGWCHKSTPKHYVVIDDDGIRIDADVKLLETNAGSGSETYATKLDIVAPDMNVFGNLMTQGIPGGAGASATFNNTTITENVTESIKVNTPVYEITVPEFVIYGNLHVTGDVHCTWKGGVIDVAYGGTGADLSATGGSDHVVCQLTPGGPFEVRSLGELPVSVLYDNATPVPVTIGGIEAGTTFSEQTMSDMWDALLYPYQYPAFSSFAITGQGQTLEVGATTNANPSFTWALTNSSNVVNDTINIYDTTTAEHLVTNHNSTGPAAVTHAGITLSSAGAHVYTITCENTKLGTFTLTFVITAYWRRYYGESASSPLIEAEVKGLRVSGLASSYAATYVFSTAASEYKWICFPSSWGTPSTFKDADTGFAVPFESAVVVSVTNTNGSTTNYNCYRSTNMLGGAISVVVT